MEKSEAFLKLPGVSRDELNEKRRDAFLEQLKVADKMKIYTAFR